jgi:hypothetical protein
MPTLKEVRYPDSNVRDGAFAPGMFDFPDNQIDYPPQAFSAMQGNTATDKTAPPTAAVMPVLLIAAAAYFLGA